MLLSIVIAVLILSFLVVSHEFGHFIIAKKSGIKVEEFALGYPPRILKIKKGETTYSINAIPFGGFVKLYGEEEQGEKYLKDPRSFKAKPIAVRALTIAGGVIMNFLVAVVVFYFLLPLKGFTSQQYLVFDYHFPLGQQQNFPIISFVVKGSPAEKAGLKPKTIILSGNGIEFKDAEQFVEFANNNKGKKVFLKTRDLDKKEINKVSVVLRDNPPEGEGPLGVGLGNIAEVKYKTVLEKSTVGFIHSFNLIHYSITALGYLIKSSFQERSISPLSSSVVGPVGILAATQLTLKEGLVAVLNLLALISLALVVVNIIPFPALDGGQLVFLAFEGIFKKRVPEVVEKNVNFVGFVLLVLLLILVTIKDVSQFGGMFF